MHRGAKQPRKRPRNQKCSRKAESAVKTLLQLERTEGTKEDGITAAYNLLNVKYDANTYALPQTNPQKQSKRGKKGTRHGARAKGRDTGNRGTNHLLPTWPYLFTKLQGGPAIGATSHLQPF